MHRAADNAKKDWKKAEAEGEHFWEVAKERLLQPHVAGGLMGVGRGYIFFHLLGFIPTYCSFQSTSGSSLGQDTSFIQIPSCAATLAF